MSFIVHDLQVLFQQTFGGRPYHVSELSSVDQTPGYQVRESNTQISQLSGSTLIEMYENKEIWLPVKFVRLNADEFTDGELFLPYSVIKISAKKTIVKTPMAERQGTVKELYGVDDYAISIKGFLIDDKKRVWPEREIKSLKKLFDQQEAVRLDNALTNLFLDSEQRVVIETLDLHEVEGGRKHVRPFTMQLESDSVFTLELE